jgi:hypothetical protein
MQIRFLLRISVLVALAVLIAAVLIRDARQEAAAAPAPEEAAPASASPKVIAYYFYTTQRCVTCRKIEAFSREAIEREFREALKSGEIEWRSVNVDHRKNRHFIREYQIFTRSLVLVKLKDGKPGEWKNLRRVWELVNRKDAFQRYVQDEVRSYLEAS